MRRRSPVLASGLISIEHGFRPSLSAPDPGQSSLEIIVYQQRNPVESSGDSDRVGA